MGALKHRVASELAEVNRLLCSIESRLREVEVRSPVHGMRAGDPRIAAVERVRSDAMARAVVLEVEFLRRQHAEAFRQKATLERQLAAEFEQEALDLVGKPVTIEHPTRLEEAAIDDPHREAQNLSSIRPAPGHHLLVIAEFLFSRAAFEQVLHPTIQDMREEYNAALAEGRSGKARLVRFRGTWAFLKAAGLLKLLGFVKSVGRMWSAIP
ncbi:MAG TPA: hypothetical protein VHG08_09095 [Longimicrobium sp.]|nr:hypothetical protein [Longimicrobium sp.]